LDDNARHNLVDAGLKEGDRLNHMLSNLLDMSRIEGGRSGYRSNSREIKDLIAVALEQVGNRHGVHPVNLKIPDIIPYVLVDPGSWFNAH